LERRPSIPFILITVLIDMIGIGIIIPVLPTLVGQFTDSPEAQAYWYGTLTFTFGFTQFFCAPLLGALSDRYGRRLVLLLSIAGLGTMFLTSGLVRSLPALVATRVIGGAFASNVSVANAYVADITTAENRAKSFGMIGAAFGVGFILGPLIGGLSGGIGIRVPFFVAATLSLLNFAYGLFVLPESLAPEKRSPISWKKVNPFAAMLGLVQLKGVGALVTVIALTNLAQFVIHATWVLSNTFRFGWGPPQNGGSFFAIGVVATVVQGGLLGTLLKKLGERRLVLAGLCSSTVAYVCHGLATQGWMMYAIIVMNFLSFTVASALNAVVSKAAPPHAQGLAMGSLSSLNSLIVVIAPLIGIPILARVSHLPRTDIRVGAPFFLSATLTAVALGLATWHFSRDDKSV
jgi:DHA1 family tetracycline resistance protein-like MFS transporter